MESCNVDHFHTMHVSTYNENMIPELALDTVDGRFFFTSGRYIKSCTLPETNSSPLKMDGWNTIVSGAFAVSFREGKSWDKLRNLTWFAGC